MSVDSKFLNIFFGLFRILVIKRWYIKRGNLGVKRNDL